MKACHKHRVKRVVITSSTITMLNDPNHSEGEVYTEQNWSDPEEGKAYDRSKAKAEKVVWDYVKNLPEEEKFEVVTIHPAVCVGPNLIHGDFASSQVITKLMNNLIPGIPSLMMPFVDVRDVADQHL
mmetsp:Transcript_32282/g.31575  ORF Transcript_32282/g.31575 Transcript_32282/m.31575 type:complete len:127 (+) Transcript_32282:124-504(+)